jgi:phage tail P2-like protein
VTRSLLPPNSTSLERSIEAAMNTRLNALPNPIRTLWNPDTCPTHLLGWLAWANSVDVWDQSWSEAEQRAAIRAAWFVHRHKGTIGAVRRALAALNIGLEIREWFETGDPRGTFRIDAFADYIFTAGFGVNPALFAMIAAHIDTTKRASQHYTLRVGERFTTRQPVRAGARAKALHQIEAMPDPRTFFEGSVVKLRTTQQTLRAHRVVHDVLLRAA